MRVIVAVFLTGLTLCGASLAQVPAYCEEIVPNRAIVCPYTQLPVGHNISFPGPEQKILYTANFRNTTEPAEAIFNLGPNMGWALSSAAFAVNKRMFLGTFSDKSCPPYAGEIDGEALQCHYGNRAPWLGFHRRNDVGDPDDDEWIILNLSTDAELSLNIDIQPTPSWVHDGLALMSGNVSSGTVPPATNQAQIFAVSITPQGFDVTRYAADKLWDDGCLTGRVSTQVTSGNSCFDGQRLTLTRRCDVETMNATGWTWFNTIYPNEAPLLDESNWCVDEICALETHCLKPNPRRIAKLRVYVTELSASCEPKVAFDEMIPVREPPEDLHHKQMGIGPEWGDMMSMISPFGDSIAFAALLTDPTSMPQQCAGFKLNPLTEDPMSGNATRWTHTCRLGADLTCIDGTVWRAPVDSAPPESTEWPTFLLDVDTGEEFLLHNTYLSDVGPQGLTVTYGQTLVSDVGTPNFLRTPLFLEAEKPPVLAIPTPVGFVRSLDTTSQNPRTPPTAANGERIDDLISGLTRQFERLARKHSRRSVSQVRPATFSPLDKLAIGR